MAEKLYRANWALHGLKGKLLKPGDTIRLTAEEAAPYVGGVLSPADEDTQVRTEQSSGKEKPGQQEQGQSQGAGDQLPPAGNGKGKGKNK